MRHGCTCPSDAAILNVAALDCPIHYRPAHTTSWSDATPTIPPATLHVPLIGHDWTEPRLMAALEFVIREAADTRNPEGHPLAVARAVDWLHAKYGSTP